MMMYCDELCVVASSWVWYVENVCYNKQLVWKIKDCVHINHYQGGGGGGGRGGGGGEEKGKGRGKGTVF